MDCKITTVFCVEWNNRKECQNTAAEYYNLTDVHGWSCLCLRLASEVFTFPILYLS